MWRAPELPTSGWATTLQRRAQALTRRQISGIALVAFASSGVIGWVAGSSIQSPAEIAARTAPPAPSPILIPAEMRELATTVVTRGTGRHGSPRKLLLAPSLLRPSAGVIGRVPIAGTAVKEGDVLLTVSGRPVFVLTGVQPTFRDLGPGLEGDDVRQLEEALQRLGFAPGEVDGVYDSATEAAVGKWYTAAGYSPFRATPEQLAAIRSLEIESATLRADLLAAETAKVTTAGDLQAAQATGEVAAAAARRAPSQLEAAHAEADAMLRLARTEVLGREATLTALKAPPKNTPSTTAEIAAAEADVRAAQATLKAAYEASNALIGAAAAAGDPQAALDAQNVHGSAMNAAAADAAAKQRTLDKIKEGTPLAPSTAGEIANAERELAAAKINEEVTRLAARRLVADAEAAYAASRAESAKASAALASATASVANAGATADVRRRAADATLSQLGLAHLRAGIQVPANEAVFLPSVPVLVAEVGVARGQEASGPLMTVTDATVAIDGALPIEAFQLVKAGMDVLIDEPQLGIKAKGVVERVASTPGTEGADGFHVYFQVRVDAAPPTLIGASVRLGVAMKDSGGKVLTVPVSALSLAPDGSSRVQRQDANGAQYVGVMPGLSANGFVAVTPVEGSLKPGDNVVIGFARRTAAPQ